MLAGAALLAALSAMATPQDERLPVLTCQEVGASAPRVVRSEARETRRRVRAVCRQLGAAPITCAYLDAVVVRESSGRAGVRHTKGEGEHGLGATGLSLRWHRDKWPGTDEDPAFCVPEVAALVSMAILWRASQRFGASSPLEWQAIYAGQWFCTDTTSASGRTSRECHATPTRRNERSICGRMRQRGFDCRTEVSADDLGRFVPRSARRKAAARLHWAFEDAHPES